MPYKTLSFVLITILALGCSSQSSTSKRSVHNNYCSPTHKPLDTKLEKTQKIALEKSDKKMDELDLAIGEYTYTSTEIHYEDLTHREKPIHIHLIHYANNKEDQLSPLCARGIEPTTKITDIDTQIPTSIQVISASKLNFTWKNYSFSLDASLPSGQKKLNSKVNEGQKDKFTSPKEVLTQDQASYQMYRMGNKIDFHLRSKKTLGAGKTLYTTSFFKYKFPIEISQFLKDQNFNDTDIPTVEFLRKIHINKHVLKECIINSVDYDKKHIGIRSKVNKSMNLNLKGNTAIATKKGSYILLSQRAVDANDENANSKSKAIEFALDKNQKLIHFEVRDTSTQKTVLSCL